MVYEVERVHPRQGLLTLDVADGSWHTVLNALLPRFDDFPDEGPFVICIPGLRCRPLHGGRIALQQLGSDACVELRLPGEDAAAAGHWVASLLAQGNSLWAHTHWTAAERNTADDEERGDPLAHSRVLRRLAGFGHLPWPALIGEDQDVPGLDDFAELAVARRRSLGRALQASPRPPRGLPRPVGRPAVLAVVSGHDRGGQGLDGLGRTSAAVGLARGLAELGVRVRIVDGDPLRPVRRMLLGDRRVEEAATRGEDRPSAAVLRELAVRDGVDVSIVDVVPHDQRAAVDASDAWVAVVPGWAMAGTAGEALFPSRAVGRNGRALPPRWENDWLGVMRANRWEVDWVLDVDPTFQLFPADACAGLVLVGAQELPGANWTAAVRTGSPCWARCR